MRVWVRVRVQVRVRVRVRVQVRVRVRVRVSKVACCFLDPRGYPLNSLTYDGAMGHMQAGAQRRAVCRTRHRRAKLHSRQDRQASTEGGGAHWEAWPAASSSCVKE